MPDSPKKKLIDAAVLSIATLTVAGTYFAQNARIDAIEASVKSNTQWRQATEKSLESIAKSMRNASAKIDSSTKEILQQIELKQ